MEPKSDLSLPSDTSSGSKVAFSGDAISPPSSLSSLSVSETTPDSSMQGCNILHDSEIAKGTITKTAKSIDDNFTSSVNTAYKDSTTDDGEWVSELETALSSSITTDSSSSYTSESEITTASDSVLTARSIEDFVLPEAVYSEYSMEPSETAVEFPQESVGIPGDTFHVCNDALPRFVDSLEVIGRVPCEPVPLDHLPREWQMIHSSSEASEDSGSFGEIDELDSITAKSIDTSAPSVKLSEAPHSEYYSHPPMSQYFVDKNLINIGKYCGNAVCLSQYLLDELNENAMEFSLFPPKLQDGVGETVDGGNV